MAEHLVSQHSLAQALQRKFPGATRYLYNASATRVGRAQAHTLANESSRLAMLSWTCEFVRATNSKAPRPVSSSIRWRPHTRAVSVLRSTRVEFWLPYGSLRVVWYGVAASLGSQHRSPGAGLARHVPGVLGLDSAVRFISASWYACAFGYCHTDTGPWVLVVGIVRATIVLIAFFSPIAKGWASVRSLYSPCVQSGFAAEPPSFRP